MGAPADHPSVLHGDPVAAMEPPPAAGADGEPRLAMLGIAAFAAIAATSGAAATVAFDRSTLTALQLSFWRALVAAACLLLVAGGLVLARRLLGRPVPPRAGAWRRPGGLLGGLGLGVVLAVILTTFFAAVDAIGIAAATLVQLGTAPLFVVGVGATVLGRRLDRPTAVALGLALVGLALVVGEDPTGGGTVSGYALGVASGAALGGMFLASAPLGTRLSALQVNVLASVGSAVVLAVAVAVTGGPWAEASGAGVAATVYLGVAVSVVAFGIYHASAPRLRAPTVSVVSLLEPVVAAVIAALAFGEALGPRAVLGAALLLAAVALLDARPAPGGASP